MSKVTVLENFVEALVATVLGNIVYFLLEPSLPLLARHRPLHVDVGMAVDFWFCLVGYGIIRTAKRWK